MPDSAAPRNSTSLTLPLRVGDLRNRRVVTFHLSPDAGSRDTLARDLGIRKLRKLGFRGTLNPEGDHDWRLDAVLGATAVQDCVITAEPVTTRLDLTVVRRFVRQMPPVDAPEVEIPEDDTLEPLGAVIDPGIVMAEALALALPDYPRVPGARLEHVLESQPADGEGREEDRAARNPFAALAALKTDVDRQDE